MLRTAARRPAFTLVELLVAAAVCVLIMAVLATAFQLGIDTMRHMKATGDMMDQLRGAESILKADLKANHVRDADNTPKRLSEFRWDHCRVKDDGGSPPKYIRVVQRDGTGAEREWAAPKYGFVRIGSSPPTTAEKEGADADQLTSAIARNHFLHFTSILSGESDDAYYSAVIPNQPQQAYRSQAAEIAYFLDPTPTGTIGTSGTTLHRLIRRQRLVALSDTDRRDRPWPNAYDHAVISLRPAGGGTFFLNTLDEITQPGNRLGQSILAQPSGTANDQQLAPLASRVGEDTLLSNVISFEVQVNWDTTDPAQMKGLSVRAPDAFNPVGPNPKTDHPFDTLPNPPAAGNNTPGLAALNVYDSWTNIRTATPDWVDTNPTTGIVTPGRDVPPLLIRVKAVQIRVRVWDDKTQNARQLTFVQDL